MHHVRMQISGILPEIFISGSVNVFIYYAPIRCKLSALSKKNAGACRQSGDRAGPCARPGATGGGAAGSGRAEACAAEVQGAAVLFQLRPAGAHPALLSGAVPAAAAATSTSTCCACAAGRPARQPGGAAARAGHHFQLQLTPLTCEHLTCRHVTSPLFRTRTICTLRILFFRKSTHPASWTWVGDRVSGTGLLFCRISSEFYGLSPSDLCKSHGQPASISASRPKYSRFLSGFSTCRILLISPSWLHTDPTSVQLPMQSSTGGAGLSC